MSNRRRTHEAVKRHYGRAGSVQQRRALRSETVLAQSLTSPFIVSPLVEPSTDLTAAIMDGCLEGFVLKGRTAAYRAGSPRGWSEGQVARLVRAPSREVRALATGQLFGSFH